MMGSKSVIIIVLNLFRLCLYFHAVSQGDDFRRQIATLRKFGGNQPWSLFRARGIEKLLPFLNIELGIAATWARCIGVIDLLEREGNY